MLTLFLFCSCSRAPHIVYRHLTDKELVEQSPIIVVGRIEKKETIWEERVQHGSENGVPLFWFHVNVTVATENVLRGGLKASRLEYSYWLPAAGAIGEWNSPLEGGRYVHFLRRDGNQLRSVVDFYLSTIPVTTGRHRSFSQTEGLPQTIARLLLSPGDDFAVEHFKIRSGVSHAWALIGPTATVPLVEALGGNGNPKVRALACEELRAEATILRVGTYRIYFYSHETADPPYVHVDRDALSAKFWLDPVSMARNLGLTRSNCARYNRW